MTAHRVVFNDWLASDVLNAWLTPKDSMEIYVRKSHRRISGLTIPSLDIANFGEELNLQELKDFLEYVEKIKGKYDCVYFENVPTHALIGFLVLRGYTLDKPNTHRDLYACLYKILPDPNLPT